MFSKNSNSVNCSRSSKLNYISDNTATVKTKNDGTLCFHAKVVSSMSPSLILGVFFILSLTEFSLTELCINPKLRYMSSICMSPEPPSM